MVVESQGPNKLLRIVALVFMAFTVLMTVMGGAGTTCVAFGAEKYDSMVGLVPYKPLYQVLVVLSLAAGVWGIMLMVALVRGGKNVWRNTILNLILGAVTSGIQTFVSQSVRGSSAPANMRFGITLITLVIFLLFRIPSLFSKAKFDLPLKGGGKSLGAGIASLLCGMLILTTDGWLGMTHLRTWIDVLRWPITISGWGLFIVGLVLLARVLRVDVTATAAQTTEV